MNEYYKVDAHGNILGAFLFEDDDVIPPDHYPGWGGRAFYMPIYSRELGDWIEGLSIEEIMKPRREMKAAELSDQCETVIKYGFYHEGDFFAFYDKDQMNFGQQLSLMLVDETILTTLWKTENNGIKQFTRQQFIDICKAGERHKRANIGHFWQLKNYVLTHDFATVEELDAINFGTELAP